MLPGGRGGLVLERQPGQPRGGVTRGGAAFYAVPVSLHLSQIPEADELLTNDPLALLVGMVLDQPVSERWSEVGRSSSV